MLSKLSLDLLLTCAILLEQSPTIIYLARAVRRRADGGVSERLARGRVGGGAAMRWRRLPPADVEACCRAQHAAGGRAASGANGGADSQSSGARAASAAARGRGARAAGPCWLVCSLACATAFFLCLYLLFRCTCPWFNPGVVRVSVCGPCGATAVLSAELRRAPYTARCA